MKKGNNTSRYKVHAGLENSTKLVYSFDAKNFSDALSTKNVKKFNIADASRQEFISYLGDDEIRLGPNPPGIQAPYLCKDYARDVQIAYLTAEGWKIFHRLKDYEALGMTREQRDLKGKAMLKGIIGDYYTETPADKIGDNVILSYTGYGVEPNRFEEILADIQERLGIRIPAEEFGPDTTINDLWASCVRQMQA
jgi:hypothetical protein